jgi:hypothetical protein
MKTLSTILLMLSFAVSANQSVCQQMLTSENNDNNLKVIEEVEVLTKETWYQTDVVLNFSYEDCYSAVKQELIEFNGIKYYRFRSIDDSCDGGNTYGAIYSLDLKTPIAHIYDYDLYCEDNWSAVERYSNNKCNTKAMELAEEKMKSFGLPFEATHARVELRDPYIFDFINIEGRLVNGEERSVELQALVRVESCEIRNVRITNLLL